MTVYDLYLSVPSSLLNANPSTPQNAAAQDGYHIG
jgi:hypothetical protein